jgi:hypothetical protein
MSRIVGLLPILIASVLIISAFYHVSAVITLADTSIEEYVPTGYRGGISFHVGEICIACHSRFSKDRPYVSELPYNVSNNALLHIFPCSKPACHINNPPTKWRPKGTKRWDLHLKICENCHPRWNTSLDTIHNTHLNFSYLMIDQDSVDCRFCHASPLGYNSSIVQVPPWPEDITKFKDDIIRPSWGDDCGFCHFTIQGAARVHDVHEPVLLNACPVCHSPYILDSENMFNRINFPFPLKEEIPPTIEDKLISTVTTNESIIRPDVPDKTPTPTQGGALPILSEFYLYFDGILDGLLDIYKRVV